MNTITKELAVALVALFAAATTAHSQNYALVDLGALPGGASVYAAAVNSLGQVTGSLSLPSGFSHAFLYSNGTMTDLGTLGGSNSSGSAINVAGAVTGTSDTAVMVNNAVIDHAFLYSSGTMTDLGSLIGADGASSGLAINASGQVTGGSQNAGTQGELFQAFLYTNGVMAGVGPEADTQVYGTAINASGEVGAVIESPATGGPPLIVNFLVSNGQTTNIGFTPTSINDSGQAVGNSADAYGNVSAWIYSAGTTVALGSLGGLNTYASSINNSGQVVGTSELAAQGAAPAFSHTFLYSNGTMTDVNALIGLGNVITLSDLLITDSGSIYATVALQGAGQTHVYVLQPSSSIMLTPAGVDFGNEPIGVPSSPQTALCGKCSVSLTNNGAGSVPVNGIATSSGFSQTNNCGAVLAAGASCVINTAFTPPGPDTWSGELAVSIAGTQYAAVLSGVGAIALTLSSSSPTAIVGIPFTLQWSGTAGATCTASAGDGSAQWNGPKPVTGSMPITETTGGKYTYQLSCTDGMQTAVVQTTVTVSWPAVTVSLSASPASITSGQSTTVTWTSTNATSCSATGGGENDGWSGSKALTGNQIVTEAYAVSAPLTLTFTLACTSSVSGLSARSAATVTESPQPAAKGGGGGFDLLSLFALFCLWVLRGYSRVNA